MGKRYRFVGEGAGVPGLPHELTEDEARALGVEMLLMEALKTGTYEEVKPPKGPKPAAQERD